MILKVIFFKISISFDASLKNANTKNLLSTSTDDKKPAGSIIITGGV